MYYFCRQQAAYRTLLWSGLAPVMPPPGSHACQHTDGKRESADKPGSVMEQSFIWDARRRTPRATYPGTVRTTPVFPYLVLLRMGFTLPYLLPGTRCALTAPFHPYPDKAGRYIFCGTFRRLSPPRRYLASCPVEPGLSSPGGLIPARSDCLANSRDQL